MSDLISRHDAIDAICKVWCYTTYGMCPHDDGYCKGCDEIEAIDALPSAEAVQGWIPVSDRFPYAKYGEGDSVLCCTETGLMYILYWNGGNWCVPTGEPHEWVNHKTGWHDKVIAWMPLPESYKGGDDE